MPTKCQRDRKKDYKARRKQQKRELEAKAFPKPDQRIAEWSKSILEPKEGRDE